MEGYTNPKMEFIWSIIGPTVNFLERHNISGMWLPVVLLGTYLYFLIFHKRPKKKKLSFIEKYWIAGWIVGLSMAIFLQILLIVNPAYRSH